jgi:urate oxidase
MVAVLDDNNYGKTGVRLLRVTRLPDRHELDEWSVDVRACGDFEDAYARGDNSKLLPTDSMRNRIYAMACGHGGESMEQFGLRLLRQFLDDHRQMTHLTINLFGTLWEHIEAAGKPHGTAFCRKTGERRLARVSGTQQKVCIASGIDGLAVLKTTNSRFEGFLRDRYTTLKDASSRILSTEIHAIWSYINTDIDFDKCWQQARLLLLEQFATHQSTSLQQTLQVLGSAVLKQNDAIGEILLSLPNHHCILMDLSPFGLQNDGEIFMPTETPSGLIEARLKRC